MAFTGYYVRQNGSPPCCWRHLGVVRPFELPDLYVAAGRLSGVLDYAALDLGYAQLAKTHGAAAFRLGELAGSTELLAWSRGTQSLIARFEQDYAKAQEFIHDGLRFAGVGTSKVRLPCSAAQCAANLGDGPAAVHYIAGARRARERSGPDTVEGLFGFSPAKQFYYAASALMWLPDGRSAERCGKKRHRRHLTYDSTSQWSSGRLTMRRWLTSTWLRRGSS